MPHLPHRAEHQRPFIIRTLRRRAPGGGEQLPFTRWGVEAVVFIQPRRAGVVEGRARPLNMAHIAHFLPGHAVEKRAELSHLVPDLLVVLIVHRIAHFAGQQTDDLPVALHIPRRRDCLFKSLKPAVGAGEDATVLAPGGGRQQDIGNLRRFGHEDILHHHEVQRLDAFAHQAEVGFGLQRIFAHDVVGFDLAGQRFMRHFGDAGADLVIHLRRVDPPGGGEFGPHGGVGDLLIAGEQVRQHAHIAGALHIVLSTNRAHADVRTPQVAGEQRQACQAAHHVHRLAKLGDPHAPHNGGGRGGGKHAHRLANSLRADPDNLFHCFRGVILHRLAVGVQPFGVAFDIGFVVQLLLQQDIAEGVHQRHIAAVVELQMTVGYACGFNASRIADDDLSAVFPGFDHPAGDDGMGVGAVVAKDQQALRVFDVAYRVAHRPVAQRLL